MFTLRELARHLNADFRGDPDYPLSRLSPLQTADDDGLAFLASNEYRHYLADTRAGAVVLKPADAQAFAGNVIFHHNPYLAYARLSGLFSQAPRPIPGIHPTAVVADSAELAPGVSVAANAVIEDGARLGEGVAIGAGCFVGAETRIGDHSRLYPNVTLYHGVSVGAHVIIHSGAVIGSDGFGFANDGGEWVKIHQLGGVTIGDRVEIGACTTIDRGALADTEIGHNVILDSQVQIAHNVRVGDNTAMAGRAAVAGSTTIGKNCVLAGDAGLVGHIEICDGVTVTARTMITKSIIKPGSYSSGTPFSDSREWRKNAVRFGQLDKLARRIARLEEQNQEK